MNHEDVLAELSKETGAHVTGYLKDGWWYLTAEKKFVYLPPLEIAPRWSLSPPEAKWEPALSTANNEKRYTVIATGKINYWDMEYQLLVIARNLYDQLELAYNKAVDADHPRQNRFGDMFVGSDPWARTTSDYLKSLREGMTIHERNKLYYGDWVIPPSGEQEMKFKGLGENPEELGSVFGIRFRQSNYLQRDEAFYIHRNEKIDREFERFNYPDIRGKFTFSNDSMWGRFVYGSDPAYWPEKKPNPVQEAWDKHWRVTGRYEWEWMNRLGDWLNRKFKGGK